VEAFLLEGLNRGAVNIVVARNHDQPTGFELESSSPTTSSGTQDTTRISRPILITGDVRAYVPPPPVRKTRCAIDQRCTSEGPS